jgi:4-amino-4-deoxy-L-arabinose transferase-like glycosyltransferase
MILESEDTMTAIKTSTIFTIVLTGIVVRLSFMLILATYDFNRINDTNTCPGGEIKAVAISILQGHGFGSPFSVTDNTGPTAWVGPVYPYALSIVYNLFGSHGSIAPKVIFSLQAVLSALTVIPMLGIARYTVGRMAGLLAAWIWAIFPWFSKWSVTWVWETSLSALLLCLIIWYALYLSASSRTVKHWIGFGILAGFTILASASLVSIIAICLLFCCYKMPWREWLKPVLSGVICLIVLSPWAIRNYTTFHQVIFTRSNFWAEFYQGNYHRGDGLGTRFFHPTGSFKEYAAYKQLGEVGYDESRKKIALQFVRDNPKEFFATTMNRVSYFWMGSTMDTQRGLIAWYWMPSMYRILSLLLLPALVMLIWRKVYAWQVVVGVLVLYPLPYCLAVADVRYRHPIEPLMLLLASYVVIATYKHINRPSTKVLLPIQSDLV